MKFPSINFSVYGKRTYLVLVSVLIGALTTLCAALLKKGVMLMEHIAEHLVFDSGYHQLFLILPAIGILLTVTFWRLMKIKNERRGMTAVIYNISKQSSVVARHKLFSQMVSSIFTVGFGGSAGLEAPIASTGSAIGSNIASKLKFSTKERTLLLACGAAAGISAIFNAPIAGVVFALELLLIDMPVPVVIPLLISSATAAFLSRYFNLGQPFVLITDTWNSSHILYYLALAALAAIISIYCIKIYFFISSLFSRITNVFVKALIGGTLLGLLIFLFPPLYGEGYDSVQLLLHNQSAEIFKNITFFEANALWLPILAALLMFFLKVVATSFTVFGGGNGGMFGSSLFTGAMLGFTFSRLVNIMGWAELNEINFTVIGMASMLSGVLQTPLTAIFLIAEITGGYALFVPLMITTSITYLATRYVEPHSVYTKQLALKGGLINLSKDKQVISKMKLRDYLETDLETININATLGDLIKAIRKSRRNIFPVVDAMNHLQGIILLDDVKSVMFDQSQYDKGVKELMQRPPLVLDIDEDMERVLEKFEEYEAWNFPVTEKGVYAGFVSKSKIFTFYRQLLIQESDVPMHD